MPISEDEYEIRSSQAPISMSKAEMRKTHKPIMEKRRRARINHCLNEIKSLILKAMNKDPARHSKLEKADILEMAVKHLQNVQKQQLALAMAIDPSVMRKFKTGFNECANEIDKFVDQIEGVDFGMKERIRSHLQKCINGIEQFSQFSYQCPSNFSLFSSALMQQRDSDSTIGDKNNNARLQVPSSIQLIPSRLPSGELALLLSNLNSTPFAPSSSQPREHTSAFAAVVPSSTTSSPLSPKAFRPVQQLYNTSNYQEQPQVLQVSSSLLSPTRKSEISTLNFPTHTFSGSERKLLSPRKIIEPLCIITNQAERHKQAQTRDDAIDFEENRLRGVKRELPESSAHDCDCSAPKVIKTEPSSSSVQESEVSDSSASGSREKEGGSDMWRPW